MFSGPSYWPVQVPRIIDQSMVFLIKDSQTDWDILGTDWEPTVHTKNVPSVVQTKAFKDLLKINK